MALGNHLCSLFVSSYILRSILSKARALVGTEKIALVTRSGAGETEKIALVTRSGAGEEGFHLNVSVKLA